MDLIYQMDEVELGINQLLQLIELSYGEGKFFHGIIFLIYFYDYPLKNVIEKLHFFILQDISERSIPDIQKHWRLL